MMHAARRSKGRPGRSGIGIIAAAALVAAASGGAVPAAVPDADHEVQMGATSIWPFDYAAYYPTDLAVHRGDVVRFETQGFHTVTILPDGQERESWLRADEVEPITVLSGYHYTPGSCAEAGAEALACVFDDLGASINSGWMDLIEGPYRELFLTVDVPVGSYVYFCAIHSGMQGTIDVVADDVVLPDAAEVEAVATAELDADTANARAILDDPPLVTLEPQGDRVVWHVPTGAITPDHRVHVATFFQSPIEITPGDEVIFEIPDVGPVPSGRIEPATTAHTVTFEPDGVWPYEELPGFVRHLHPMCDPDDERSGLPGDPVTGWPAATPLSSCPDGWTYEPGLNPSATYEPLRAPGDIVLTDETYHGSGWIVNADSTCRSGCDPYKGHLPSTFRAVFPVEGEFEFVCLVHGPEWMSGSVRVSL